MKSDFIAVDERLDALTQRSDEMVNQLAEVTRRVEVVTQLQREQSSGMVELRQTMSGVATVMDHSIELLGEVLRNDDARFEEFDKRLRTVEKKLAS